MKKLLLLLMFLISFSLFADQPRTGNLLIKGFFEESGATIVFKVWKETGSTESDRIYHSGDIFLEANPFENECTHSLWASIFLHFLNNATATLISRVWSDLPIDAGLRDVLPDNIYWIVYVAAALLLVISLVILNEKTVSPQVQAPVDA